MKHTVLAIARWMEAHEFIILILLATIMLRLPTFFEPYWYGDEGIYLAIGQGLSQGERLYTDVTDHKTPIIYWLAALTPTIPSFKGLLFAASTISIFFFHRITLTWMGKRWAQKIAVIGFTLFTTLPALEGNIVNAELLFMPWVLAAVWLLKKEIDKGKGKRPVSTTFFIAGFMLGMAVLTKVPALFDSVALLIFFLSAKRFRDSIILGLGLTTPILLSVIWFFLQGSLADYMRFGLLYNFTYITEWGTHGDLTISSLLASLPSRFLLLGLILWKLYNKRKHLESPLFFSFLWLGMSVFSAVFSLRPYPHYFLQTIPAAAILLGFWAYSTRTVSKTIALALISTILIFYAFGMKPYPITTYYLRFLYYMQGVITENQYQSGFDQSVPETYELARWMVLRTEPDEEIFVWGDNPLIYPLSGRRPVGKFVAAFHVLSMDGKKETMTALQANPPEYIVDLKKDPEEFSELYAFLKQEYAFFTEVGKATIYRFRPD